MGLYTTIYVAPYIRAKTQYGKSKRDIRTCGTHREYECGDGKFCKQCGKEVFQTEIEYTYKKSIADIMGNDNFWSVDECEEMIIWSNKHDFGLNPEHNELTKIDHRLILDKIEEFRKVHATDIKELEEKIWEKVVVEFGVFWDYS